MILCNFISLRPFTIYMENQLQFEISLRKFASKWVSLRLKLWVSAKWNFTEVKSQTGLSSLRVSCKRALSETVSYFWASKFICNFQITWICWIFDACSSSKFESNLQLRLNCSYLHYSCIMQKNGKFKVEKIIAFWKI